MENVNELIQCLNQLVDNISAKEIIIHNKLMKSNSVNRGKIKQFEEIKQNTINIKKLYYNTEQHQGEKVNILINWNVENRFNIIYNSKYNIDGYDSDGYNNVGYNNVGYNMDGYNSKGYDRYGYNREGCDGSYDYDDYEPFDHADYYHWLTW
ncbi:hypothetical protein QTN25_004324 [Entamoeba marina]